MRSVMLKLAVIGVISFLIHSPVLAEVSFEFYPDRIIKKENAVKFSFNGKVYTDPLWFDEVVSNEHKFEDDENFVVGSFMKSQIASMPELLALWYEDEQASMTELYSNAVFLIGMQGYLQKIQRAAFLAKVEYGPYSIFYQLYSSQELGGQFYDSVIAKQNGIYCLTNKLKDDPLFVYFGQKLKSEFMPQK